MCVVDLVLIEKRRGSDDRSLWQPFVNNEGFTEYWWSGTVTYDSTFLEVRSEGIEVARVELDEHVHIEHYLDVPLLGDVALEIQLIEVHKEHRRQGIATEVLRLLAQAHPERRLVAFSEEADQFWDSLGWRRHEPPETLMRPLYIQPEGWPTGGLSVPRPGFREG